MSTHSLPCTLFKCLPYVPLLHSFLEVESFVNAFCYEYCRNFEIEQLKAFPPPTIRSFRFTTPVFRYLYCRKRLVLEERS